MPHTSQGHTGTQGHSFLHEEALLPQHLGPLPCPDPFTRLQHPRCHSPLKGYFPT